MRCDRSDEPDKVMDERMSLTETGKILLESDLFLKKTAAIYLHPDHKLGKEFWSDVYGQVGKGKNGRLCYSLRQWIVPGDVQIAHTTSMSASAGGRERTKTVAIHLLRARMQVKHESAFEEALHTENSKRSAAKVEEMMSKMCKDANATLKRHAEKTYETLVLPHVESHLNTAEEYRKLRTLFYWRIVSEYAKRNGMMTMEEKDVYDDNDVYDEDSSQVIMAAAVVAKNNVSDVDPIHDKGWSKDVLFDSYLNSATKGEFLLKRQVEEDGITYLRTYFHGGLDWTNETYFDV